MRLFTRLSLIAGDNMREVHTGAHIRPRPPAAQCRKGAAAVVVAIVTTQQRVTEHHAHQFA